MTARDCGRCGGEGWLRWIRRSDGEKVSCECPVCNPRALSRLDDPDLVVAAMVAAGVPEPEARDALGRWVGPNALPGDVLSWARCENSLEDLLFWCVVLWGRPGTGKTRLAIMALGAYLRRHRRGGVYRRATDLISEIMRDRRADDPAFEAKVRSCPLLVIDDLGTERETYADVVDDLLARRESRRLMTIITTNGRPEDIGSERLLSRLRRARLIEMAGIDMRGRVA